MLERRLELAPPRVPVKIPLMTKLFTGQVEFSRAGDGAELRLANFADDPATIRSLVVRLPAGKGSPARCRIATGRARLDRAAPGDTRLGEVAIPPKGELRLRWE
jgi:hypothetical protein